MSPQPVAHGNPDPAGRATSRSEGFVRVVCPHCHTTNRVPQARLGDGAKCGSCKRGLLEGRPFALAKDVFERHLAGNDLPLVVDFWAPWCAPCRAMAPAYEQAAARLTPGGRLTQLDTEAEPETAARFGIRGIPTLIAFRNSREVARPSGAMDLASLLGWIRSSV